MLITQTVSLRELTAEERSAIEQLARSRTAAARLVERARILLATAQGQCPSQVAKDLGVSRPTVYAWIHRFNADFRGRENNQSVRSRRPRFLGDLVILAL
jgi:FixJ family two-component response regulator